VLGSAACKAQSAKCKKKKKNTKSKTKFKNAQKKIASCSLNFLSGDSTIGRF
jgi:hypothetical protein